MNMRHYVGIVLEIKFKNDEFHRTKDSAVGLLGKYIIDLPCCICK